MNNKEIYKKLLEALEIAEKKHPVFAEGIYQGLGALGEEYGETVKAVTKKESEERIMSEALDLIIVAWRFYRRDWEAHDEK